MTCTVAPLAWTGPFGQWGTRPGEAGRVLPCDRHVDRADQRLVRAVDVAAPAAEVFRWLCQLRAAPYSYDWIDNGGRRSPRKLTPGLEQLEAGQRVMTIFRLVEFEPGRSITIVHDGPVFGRVAGTYEVTPAGARASRLLARLVVRYPAGLRGAALSAVLPAGDLVMMRRQLLNLRERAEAIRE
jgi:Polyketide cyclase / dehydrase and lipid transport